MGWTIPDHQASAEEAIARGVISGDADYLATVPEPLQSTQHQARVASLSILNELGGPDAVVSTPWTPGTVIPPVEPPVDPPVEPPVEPPPVVEGWPEAFMSYDKQTTPIHLNNQHGVTIEGLSFEGFTRSKGKPIFLENCSDITIRNIDTRKCTMGLLYAYNTHGLVIEKCRAENVGFEFIDQVLDRGKYTQSGYFRNDNDCNVYQLNGCNGAYVRDIKARYGNIEDAFSHYGCDDADVARLHWEGANSDDRPTSDGSRSAFWTSRSGTGSILGDGNGDRSVIRDSIYVNPGQVGIAIAGGAHCTFDGCVVYGEAGGFKPLNVAAYVWGQYGTCSNHAVTNCRTKFANNNEWWDGGNCGSIDKTGSVFGDNTLNIEDLRVTL